jgi:hypothetical protein
MPKLIVEETKALLESKPTAALMAVVSQLEGRRSWLKAGGLQFEPSQRNVEIITGLRDVVLEDRRASAAVAPGGADELDWGLVPYTPLTSPLEHQTRALTKVSPLPFFALFMEQGTGKTWVVLHRAGELYANGIITGMIVVTKKGVHRQWIMSEFPKHFSLPFSGHYSPFKTMPTFGPGLQIISFNYDGLKTPKQLAIALEFAETHKGKLLVVGDESQEIKNAQSARHKAMEELKPFSSHRAITTGTPIAKDLTDEWAQLRWLNEKIIGIKYLSTFRASYCVMGGFEMRAVVGTKNVDDFKARTDPHLFRATKEELGILPKQYGEWVFNLTKYQVELMRELKNELMLELESGAVVDINGAAQYLIKAQQIASGFIKDSDEGQVHRLMPVSENPRAQNMLEWVQAGEGKFVIWHKFIEDRAIIEEVLREAKVDFVTYTGSDAARSAAVDSFMDPAGAQGFLANPQSGGTGLNLQGLCNRNLYYTNDWRAIDRWQSEDRTHRIGTIGVVTYTDLIAKFSPDRRIMNNLRKKKSISDLILDDIQSIFDDGEDYVEAN